METRDIFVLIVEDDPEWSTRIRRLVSQILELNNYAKDVTQNIFTAKNIEEVESIVEQQPVLNLVTMDMDLEGGEAKGSQGLELLRLIRGKYPTAVSIVISGRGKDEAIMHPSFSEHRVFDVVDKSQYQIIKDKLLAAVYYADVIRLKDSGKLDEAEKILKKLEPTFPGMGVFKDVQDEIKRLYRDQTTGLPGRDAVYKRINELRTEGQIWEICSTSINNFQDFLTVYLNFNATQVTKLIAKGFKQAYDSYTRQTNASPSDRIVVGYMGENEFIILALSDEEQHLKRLIQSTDEYFNATVKTLYNSFDLEGPNARFTAQNMMSLNFRSRQIKPHDFSGVDINQFLEEIWTSDGHSDAPTSW